MKKPTKADGKATMEKPKAGAHKGTGVNKPAEKASVPQVVARNTYGKIGQKAKS